MVAMAASQHLILCALLAAPAKGGFAGFSRIGHSKHANQRTGAQMSVVQTRSAADSLAASLGWEIRPLAEALGAEVCGHWRHAAPLPYLPRPPLPALPTARSLPSAEPTLVSLVQIQGPDLSEVGPKEYEAIHAALLEHQVVFFRDQDKFTPQKHQEFANLFGPPQLHPAYDHVDGYPEITVLENDRDRPSLIEKWHTDMTFAECPPLGSIVRRIAPCVKQ